jgi:anthranilate/para-aminobenzoate synthase component II
MNKVLTLGHVGMGTGTVEPFDQLFDNGLLTSGGAIRNGADIDALVIWGGEDISPSIYNNPVSKRTHAGASPSRRDRIELDACYAAIERGIPLIGVCRGAQLVCAVAGGRLIQHVNGHGGGHLMTTSDGRTMRTTSIHHQMMYPFEVEHELLAWSSTNRSDVYIIGTDETDPAMVGRPEPEVVWFPKIKALAIQGHPEFVSNPDTDPFVHYCMGLVSRYCLGQLDRESAEPIRSSEYFGEY